MGSTGLAVVACNVLFSPCQLSSDLSLILNLGHGQLCFRLICTKQESFQLTGICLKWQTCNGKLVIAKDREKNPKSLASHVFQGKHTPGSAKV